MKVMFSCFAAATHYHTLVPMAWALRTAGHEVRVVGQPDLVDTVTASGLTAVPVGCADWATSDPWAPELLELVQPLGTEHVRRFDFAGTDRSRWTWEHLLGLENVMVAALYATMNSESMIADSVAFARSWRPDLVIRETYTFAGAIAARVVGAAHARMVWGPDVALRARRAFLERATAQAPERREDPTAEWLGRVLARYGCRFDEESLTGQWTIDSTPPSARLDLGLCTVGTRYVPYNGPAVVPDLSRTRSSRPRVCLTFGTTERETGQEVTALTEMLAAVAGIDAEFVATLDATQLGQVSTLPDNVRVVDFVPLNDLLPTCRAIVHQAGAGTRATAELHGIPQLVLTDGWDSEVKAEHLVRVQAGLSLPMAELTSETLRDRIGRLLSDPALRAGAQRLRQEVLAEPSPNQIVPLIEQLTAEHRAPAAEAA
jgi:protomycinolide IV desosaminyltransferase